jgi:ABC1 atypical kinase-like domain
MSYNDGYPVFNSKEYSISYISHALGYYPRDINKSLEATKSYKGWEFPKPDANKNIKISKYASCKLSSYAKCILKTKNNVKIYETDNVNNINMLYDKTVNNKNIYESILEEEFHKSFADMSSTESQTFIIKQIPCHNIRYMYTGLKEATMMHKIDNKSTEIGVSLVPKVYFACPLYYNDKWYYIIVMEKINGVLLKTLRKPFNKLLRYIPYNKKKILEASKTALHHLWSLGFSHNDLHDGNIMYDKTSNRIIFLDCETVVHHTDEDIVKYQELSSKDYIVTAYTNTYKDSAVSLLYIASFYTISYCDSNNLIYNTDDWFLPMLQELI